MPSGNYCLVCNTIRLNEGKEEKPFYYIPKKKHTGELVLFQTIWATRPHRSFINNEWLGDDMNVCFMAHVLPKAQNKYPKFKLYDKNIVLLSWAQHDLWDKGIRADLRLLPEWGTMFKLEEALKEEYKLLKPV